MNRKSLIDRLDAKIITSPDCWIWTGALSGGYGRVGVDGASFYVHRLVFEMLVGPIPEGLVLDHTCHNDSGCTDVPCAHRRCVNPDHLEAVTLGTNSARGNTVSATKARAAAITHCPYDHCYADSTYRRPDGRRRCDVCERKRSYEYQLAKRAKEKAA